MRTTLRRDLTAALKARDRVAVAALRSAIAALENAEAVPTDQAIDTTAGNEHVAGAPVGLGVTEADRRDLTESDVRSILEAEVRERTTAAAEYDGLGRPDEAARLRAEAEVLGRYVAD
jgi:uncharacterized protein YqeY